MSSFENKLKISFPNIYRILGEKSLYPISMFGVECGKGWESLIYELSAKLESLIMKLPKEERESSYVVQIKEKYGSLRFYMSCETDEMFNLITQAEEESENTCEICGAPGKINGAGWLSCRCEEHR